MTIFKLMTQTRVRVAGLLLLVGLAAGCGQGRGSGSDKAFLAGLERGRDAYGRQDFATAADAFAQSASVVRTGTHRAKMLILQSAAEIKAKRPEAALETTKRAEDALRQAGKTDPELYSHILMVRNKALRSLGREAEALEVLALLSSEEETAAVEQKTSVDPDSGPIPHGTLDMYFLPRIGNMRLRKISRFDPDGSNMAGHYDLIPSLHPTASPFQLSAFVAQGPSGDPRDELAATVKAFQSKIADARLVGPAHRMSATIEGGARVTGWRVVLIIPSLNAYTEMMMFQGRGAVVAFHAAYPVPLVDAISPEIRVFLTRFDWPPVDPPGRRRR